jgi:hypothetical protein
MKILSWLRPRRVSDILRIQGQGTAATMHTLADELEGRADELLRAAHLLRDAARTQEARSELAAQVYEYALGARYEDQSKG